MHLHKMNLNHEPFEAIKSGQKIDELRINDEKRRLLHIGDHIEFSKRPDLTERMLVEVTFLNRYKNFGELYDVVKERYTQYTKDEFVASMYEHYPKEEEVKYGALAIGIKLL